MNAAYYSDTGFAFAPHGDAVTVVTVVAASSHRTIVTQDDAALNGGDMVACLTSIPM